MIARYSHPQMEKIFSDQHKFENLLAVESEVAWCQAQRGLIPKKAAIEIRKKAKVKVDRIQEIEKTTRHDVIAFVSQVAETVGPSGKYLHFGLTSSDVLDTAMSLTLRQAWNVLSPELYHLEKSLEDLVWKERKTLCAGRTHGMHAEPSTYGYIIWGHLEEFRRAHLRIKNAVNQLLIVKLSGAVGTYSSCGPEIEADVGRRLKLTPETVATQVIPRDRHAELFCAFALWGSAVERLCVDLRHRQRTEMNEVQEGFDVGQKGSSAMPHKRNPISAENLTGIARLLRSYVSPALENIVLWHERDISHSSVERVLVPDTWILAHYVALRLTKLVRGLKVDRIAMKENMERSQGTMYSSHLLLLLVKSGLSREEAYVIVQKISHGLKPGQSFQNSVLKNEDIVHRIGRSQLKELFQGQTHLKSALGRLEKNFKRTAKGKP